MPQPRERRGLIRLIRLAQDRLHHADQARADLIPEAALEEAAADLAQVAEHAKSRAEAANQVAAAELAQVQQQLPSDHPIAETLEQATAHAGQPPVEQTASTDGLQQNVAEQLVQAAQQAEQDLGQQLAAHQAANHPNSSLQLEQTADPVGPAKSRASRTASDRRRKPS